MFDIKQMEKEVQEELNAAAEVVARGKIKEHLQRIRQAEKVLANMRMEYKVLVADLAS